MHERWQSIEQLVHKDAKSVPVCCSSMTDVHDDFWSHVLRRTAESVSAIPWLDFLNETKVSQLDVAIVLDEDILRL